LFATASFLALGSRHPAACAGGPPVSGCQLVKLHDAGFCRAIARGPAATLMLRSGANINGEAAAQMNEKTCSWELLAGTVPPSAMPLGQMSSEWAVRMHWTWVLSRGGPGVGRSLDIHGSSASVDHDDKWLLRTCSPPPLSVKRRSARRTARLGRPALRCLAAPRRPCGAHVSNRMWYWSSGACTEQH